ncbi:MAG: hypothetical protein M1817_004219 [Caeruleum heppii]|nr:MAG: hypothetical protein M1817_004219 [Caeruleum heppii]
MDYGPSAEDKAAAAFFRQFWGSIAELRRFKDGSILESISWSGAGGPTKILQQAVKYLLNRHVGSGVGDSAAFEGDEAPLLLVGLDITGTQSIAPFKPLMTAFADLERSMRELEGFPLQLRQISATHPATRYASVHIPSSNGRGVAETTPIDVTIQFEGSGRWPDDLMAIQRTKIALLLKLGEMLEESVDGLNARVGLENTEYELLNCCFLDVTQSDGTTFRLRIHNDREEILLERHLNHKDRSPRDRDEAVLALATYKRDFRHLARHTRNVRTICTRFPPLSPTMRLLKVWFASHLLSGHVSEEVIEMIAIRSFLQPLPWEAPSSVRVGFLRILHFLSRWDWRVEPLVIDFGGDISGQDRAIISTRFEAWRKIDPGMNKLALFVASNVDLDGTTFTHMGPSKPVAARMTTLARAAFDIVKTAGQSLMQEALFASSTADFDFVIHLAPPFVRADARQKSKQVPQFKNLQTPSDPGRDTVGYEPVQLFLTDLRVGAPNKAQSPRDQQADWRQALFSANILFFHNPVAGSIIAGIWSPSTGPRPWKVNQSYSTVPLAPEGGDETARININKPAILNDIARLGGDLITRIELHR